MKRGEENVGKECRETSGMRVEKGMRANDKKRER